MRFHNLRSMHLFFCLALGSMSVLAQTTTVATVSTSVPIAQQTVGTTKYAVSLGISYPVGLTPSSYISASQLGSDVAGFVAAYPNANDPLEAIFSTVLSNLLSKYPQMTGGSIVAGIPLSINTTTGVVTQYPTTTVIIGTFPAGTVLGSNAAPVPAAMPAPAVTTGK